MRALLRRFSIPLFLQSRTVRFGAGLGLATLASPKPPGPEWVRLRPIMTGICGTDLASLAGRLSPALLPYASFPSVPGHEVVAHEVETGRRVVLQPFLGCEARHITPPCVSCAAGQTARCEHFDTGSLAAGTLIGFCRDLPGGWGEEMVAPRAQLYAVPEAVSDTQAVLVEPLAVALHAVLLQPPAPGTRVGIVGCGTIGLLTIAALHLLQTDCQVTVHARRPLQAELAGAFGAEVARDSLSASSCDQTYDCAGSVKSLRSSLRVTKPGGRVILLGTTGWSFFDWTAVWSRELTLVGAVGYGREHWRGREAHTFELALDLLAAHPEFPLERLITHRFPLEAYKEALETARHRRGDGSMKVVFTPV